MRAGEGLVGRVVASRWRGRGGEDERVAVLQPYFLKLVNVGIKK